MVPDRISAVPLLITCVFLAGCVAREPFVLPADHPANPGAPVAPARVAEEVLGDPDPVPGIDAGRQPVDGDGMHGEDAAVEPGERPVVYTCPMHPQVATAVPGKCPICAMELVRKEGGAR